MLGRSEIAVDEIYLKRATLDDVFPPDHRHRNGALTMRPTLLVFRREFAAYFATPVAAVFLIVFLALSAGMTFLVSGFFEHGQADLSGFFFWHPWLYLVLMPAIAMRLWAEERRSGTIELLMTLPVAALADRARQVARRLGFRGARAGADDAAVDHRQRARLARQRRHPGVLYRLMADGRRVPGAGGGDLRR